MTTTLSPYDDDIVVEWPGLASQVERGAYIGKDFVSDTHAKPFFDLCKQVGGPRLLPSKPRGSSTDPSSENNGPVASISQRSNEDVDRVEADAANMESQVCTACTGELLWGPETGLGVTCANRHRLMTEQEQ